MTNERNLNENSTQHIKKDLLQIKNNIYINPKDPNYHEKIIKYVNPNDGESHFFLGQKYKRLGDLKKAVYHYEKSVLIKSNYQKQAEHALRMMHTLPAVTKKKYDKRANAMSTMLKTSLIIALLFFNIILLFLLFQSKGSEQAFAIIGEENNTDATEIFEVVLPHDVGGRQIEMFLFEETMNIAIESEHTHFFVYGVDAKLGNKLIVAEYDSTRSPQVSMTYEDEQIKLMAYQYETVAINMIRTAVNAYIQNNEQPPKQLEQLASNYPNNYLSFIPKVDGLLYDANGKTIEEMVMLRKNLPYFVDQHIPYEPMKMIINKETYVMKLMSGRNVLAEKKVGLGKNGQTPTGTFSVRERVLQPNSVSPGAYGQAGLGLGEIAVHGTYATESIGANHSLGCIRMTNEDILAIFPFVPKGTNVIIVDRQELNDHLQPIHLQNIIPIDYQLLNETTDQVFHWLG